MDTYFDMHSLKNLLVLPFAYSRTIHIVYPLQTNGCRDKKVSRTLIRTFLLDDVRVAAIAVCMHAMQLYKEYMERHFLVSLLIPTIESISMKALDYFSTTAVDDRKGSH